MNQVASTGGVKERLRSDEDKLLFILVYQKTYPIQTMHGLQFELSQPQVNYWIHRFMPVLQESLFEMGMTPERVPLAVAENRLVKENVPDLLIDGTERRRQRPKDAKKQKRTLQRQEKSSYGQKHFARKYPFSKSSLPEFDRSWQET